MYSAWVLIVVLLGTVGWLGFLSYLIWKQGDFIQRLFPKDEQGDIRDKLQEVLQAIDASREECLILNKHVREVSKDGLRHLQRLEMYRYNPYNDTGGDQSFSVAILDGVGNGVVMTSLHTRAGTRIYTKPIQTGKSEIKLSKEEELVVTRAMK